MIEIADIIRLGDAVAGADCHTRRELIEEFAEKSGLSPGTVRRYLARNGFTPDRRRRRDAGTARVGDDVRFAAEQVLALKRTSGDRLTTRGAVDLAGRKGLIPADVSVTALEAFCNRMVVRRQVEMVKDDKSRAPARVIDWKFPGHCLQVDATNCAQWFFKDRIGYRLADGGEVYCNKPDRGAPIIRYIGVDAASHCMRVRYYQTHAERADDLIDFLIWCMNWSSDDPAIRGRDPMCGVPDVLFTDKGSGNRSSAVRNFCDCLGIELRFHAKGNPRAKGAVERAHGLWGQSFERELAVDPARDLDELNERAWAYARGLNCGREHRRLGQSRAAFYAAHRAPLRMPPPRETLVEYAMAAPQTRVIANDLLIDFDGRRYYVGAVPGVRPRDRVRVTRVILDADPNDAPIRVARLDPAGEPVGSSYRLAAVRIDERGRYSEPALYRADVPDAYDLQRASDAARLDAITIPRATRPADADVPGVTPPAVAVVIAPAMASPKVSAIEARRLLRQYLGRDLTDADAAAIAGWTGDVDLIAVRRMADGLLARAATRETAASRIADAG